MKVLFDNQIYKLQRFGGISRYFNELKKINSENIEVISTDTMIDTPDPLRKNNLFLKGTRLAKAKFGIANKTAERPPHSYVNTFQTLNFDLFHPTYYDPYFFDLTHKPYVLTVYDMIHELYAEHFDQAAGLSATKQKLCDRASAVITISETTKRDVIDIFKLPEDKVHAIPLACDLENIIAEKPEGIQDAGRYILFVGLRSAYKNFYFAARALSELIKQDKDLSLLCTGHGFSDGELQFFKDLGIENQVKHIYLQNDSQLAWVYENARLFIFPSLYEGFGFPLLEAFAKNCPVISGNGGSLKEVGGNAALYFDPKKINEIQDCAYKLLYDDDLRVNMISKGQAQLSTFSWGNCRNQTIEVYKKCLKMR